MDHYYERNLIINNRQLNYKGIFRFDEIVSKLNRIIEEKGYQKREKKSEEVVGETGRKMFIELRPFKDVSNYCRLAIKIKFTADNLTETVEEVAGMKKKFQRGDINIGFDAWVLTDMRERWSTKAWVYFLKAIINKYFYTMPLEPGYQEELMSDTAYIYVQMKQLLNSYKFEVGREVIKEEEVVKSVGKEVEREMKRRKVP